MLTKGSVLREPFVIAVNRQRAIIQALLSFAWQMNTSETFF